MAYYPPPQGYTYPPAPYPPQPYPPAPYDPSYYQQGYAPPPPPVYSGYGPPPSKKQKNNSGSAHYPPPTVYAPSHSPPPVHGYGHQPAYPAYPPVSSAHYPPPPPGWLPPPPPGWAGQPIPPPSPFGGAQYPAPYPPPANPPAPTARESKTPAAGFPRSKQWHNPNGPYGQVKRATSVVASATSQSSPREHSSIPTPPTATPSSVALIPRERSQGSVSHVRNVSAISLDLHVEDDDYWYNDDEELNPALSLGTIVWKPGTPISQAIPAVWKTAEKWYLDPPPPIDAKREQSRSRYVTTKENEGQECRPARESEMWPKMRHDPIFADLTIPSKFISRKEAIAARARPALAIVKVEVEDDDEDAEEGEISGGPPVYDWTLTEDYDAKFGSSPPGHRHFNADVAPPPPMINPADIPIHGIKEEDEVSHAPPQAQDLEDDLIENAIRAAEAKAANNIPLKRQPLHNVGRPVPQLQSDLIPDLSLPPRPPRGLKRSRSRSRSPERRNSKTAFPMPKIAEKDQAQEDMLAALGVTGSPKPVFTTPGPAYMPPPEGYVSGNRTPVQGMFPVPPPPPPPPCPSKLDSIVEDEDDGNPWSMTYNTRGATPNSVASAHTAVGSDFNNAMIEDNEATPKAQPNTKRPRTDDANMTNDSLKKQDDEATPRAGRVRAPRIHEAFSRRW